MTEETHVDGNALGGMLMEMFGREMTDALGSCGNCGKVHAIGEMRVYRGPGDVVRCPTCTNVVAVAVTIGERSRMHMTALRWLEASEG